MAVKVRQTVNPTETEIEQFTKVLAESFEYRFFGFALGGERRFQEPMHKAHLNAALAKNEGEVHIAEWEGQGVVGVSVWFPPGQKFLETETQREAGWKQLMADIGPKLSGYWSRLLNEYDDMVENSLGHGVKLGGYHLQLIGVLPEFQRKGVGRALLDFAEAKARAARVCTCLETGSGGVKTYEKLGYTLAGSGQMHSVDPERTFEMCALIKHTEA
ncbi:acyl-CoA N-acyltransferase [Daedaleopsis nitida]|nr:acyl-CoA N-acyltransferase [Daedaleopsis nitida]